MRATDWLSMRRERVLVIHDPQDLAGSVRGRYPQFDLTVMPDYLSGIAALAHAPARTVLVGVDPAHRKLSQAVAGLRKAAGPGSRVILCCTPSAEPAAREALAAGADDYLIYPPRPGELDVALGLRAPQEAAAPDEHDAAPSWDELHALAGVLASLGGDRTGTLEQVCRLLAETLRSPSVRIYTDGASVQTGDPALEPTLIENITAGGRTLGRILVAPRQRSPFSTVEVEKLRHYGRLIAHLLDAAEQQQHWQSMAMMDEATGLPNRRYLMQALESILARATVERFRVTVLLFDLDGFKHFNDTYGHATGDQILRETSQLFRRHCRQHDVVARYAGDEFVVVFWDAEEPRVAGSKHPTDALAVLRRFKKSLEAHEFPLLGPGATGLITISGGLASYPWDAKDAQSLIDKADEAMLQAKRAGKNRIYLVGAEGESAEDIEPNAQASSG